MLVFALNVCLNWPLFLPGESPYRDSIEGGYVGMARFIAEHPNPWGWNPLQYCGLPVQFTYLPALHYATAVLVWTFDLSAAHAWRIVTGGLACAAPVALFAFVLFFTRSRGWALAAAVAWTVFSPLYGLVVQIDKDRGGFTYLPWRLNVLVKYGEGPHNAGLALIPVSLIALWRWATVGRFPHLALAAVLLALIALTNWVAALALGICCVLMLIAVLGAPDAEQFRIGRIFAAALLAYFLACFWLTPTFIWTIAFNLPADAYHYRLGSAQQVPLAVVLTGVLLIRIVLWRLRRPFYVTFITLAVFVFGWVVLAFYWRGIDTLPESRRYALELEMLMVVVLLEWMRMLLAAANRAGKVLVAVAGVALLMHESGEAMRYVTRGWHKWRPVPIEQTIEGKLATWLNAQQPNGRVLASGGLRFRLNSRFDIQQLGGSWESGLRNRFPVHALYRLRTTPDPHVPLLEHLAIEYVVVHGPKSREHYRDFKFPHKYDGVLEAVYSVEDDTIYRAPEPSLVVPRSLSARWIDNNHLDISGTVQSADSVLVRVSWDEGWRGTQDGRTVALSRASDGFIVLKPAEAPRTRILLEYTSTTEQRIAATVSSSALVLTLALTVLARRRFPPHALE